jgi:hypothetical protein
MSVTEEIFPLNKWKWNLLVETLEALSTSEIVSNGLGLSIECNEWLICLLNEMNTFLRPDRLYANCISTNQHAAAQQFRDFVHEMHEWMAQVRTMNPNFFPALSLELTPQPLSSQPRQQEWALMTRDSDCGEQEDEQLGETNEGEGSVDHEQDENTVVEEEETILTASQVDTRVLLLVRQSQELSAENERLTAQLEISDRECKTLHDEVVSLRISKQDFETDANDCDWRMSTMTSNVQVALAGLKSHHQREREAKEKMPRTQDPFSEYGSMDLGNQKSPYSGSKGPTLSSSSGLSSMTSSATAAYSGLPSSYSSCSSSRSAQSALPRHPRYSEQHSPQERKAHLSTTAPGFSTPELMTARDGYTKVYWDGTPQTPQYSEFSEDAHTPLGRNNFYSPSPVRTPDQNIRLSSSLLGRDYAGTLVCMKFHNNKNCPQDDGSCSFSHQHVVRYEASENAKPARANKKPTAKPKRQPSVTAFPKEITNLQKKLIVVCQKDGSSAIFHHPNCRRRAEYPDNYMTISIGKILAERKDMRPASSRARCCQQELAALMK